ncbi:MAG TPA: PAS domain-containing protein, partial [Burkholderiaceae bacterium]|nr:PAS domain-containing protein [Burkholderiaceae bacterium]
MNRRSPTPPVEPESSLQGAIDAAQLGIFRWDRASGSIALRNDAAARLLGWERPQLTRAELLEQRVDRGHRDAASTAFDAAAAGSALSLRCRVRVWAEQPPRWLEFTAPAARAGDGGAAIGLIRDVSDEERERDLHRRYVDRLEASLAASRTGVWEFDLTTRDAYANDVMFEIAGASPHTPGPLGQVYWNQVYPDDMELHRSTIARAVEQRSHYRMEYRIRRLNDGAVRWVSSQGAVRCDDNGVPKWLVGTIVDITEQRATEQALLEEHERLQIALSTDPVGVFEIDIESGRRRWDPAMYRLYGVDPNVEPPVGNDFL